MFGETGYNTAQVRGQWTGRSARDIVPGALASIHGQRADLQKHRRTDGHGKQLGAGIHRVATLQSLSNSRTFPDISTEYLRSIDPRNISNTKRNACYFSLQYSYIYCHNHDNCVLQ